MGQTNWVSRWRPKKKRGVSPIIATILLVAITVVLAAVLYILISGLTHGPSSTPIGSNYSLNQPQETTCGANHCYAFEVAAAGGGIDLNDLAFTLTGPVALPAGATVTVSELGVAAASDAVYTFSTNSWAFTAGMPSTTVVSSTFTFTLTANAVLSGDQFVTIGTNSFSGQVATSIP